MLPAMTRLKSQPLPPIPVVELGSAPPLALLEAERERAEALMASASEYYPGRLVEWADRLSGRWLERCGNPYLEEIDAISLALDAPGAWFLNMNYEWACTSGVAPAPGDSGNRLLRVLDWRLPGLGANVVAVRRAAVPGPWTDLTWPGFVGCVQGLAPGRFAAALNQAPLRRHTGIRALDWAVERVAIWHRKGLPPSHLLRRVFERARDYNEAAAMLIKTPLALPAIFLLSGPKPGQGCIVERLEDRAFLRLSPAAAANHWMGAGQNAWPRGEASVHRSQLLATSQTGADSDFRWVVPPILNPTTRLAMMAEAATGRLLAQGYEAGRPVTAVLRLESGSASGAKMAASETPGHGLIGH